METFPRYWPFVRGIHWSPVNSPHKGPVTRSFDVSFDLRLNKQLRKPSCGLWFETLLCPLWRHCNDIFIFIQGHSPTDFLRWPQINVNLSEPPLILLIPKYLIIIPNWHGTYDLGTKYHKSTNRVHIYLGNLYHLWHKIRVTPIAHIVAFPKMNTYINWNIIARR